ncbi:hypothetical protein THAOC_15851 [Thalassiosira oceanica]|uniref:Uncharacterized protein n=1 Tax=Thalassiosira oceanica TaxID=159749 RepID=K0SER1_THAOC|nr:hypothetical protein THAOC_15851 [Thalassiosira oceanica]|eukprot:EJK63484.1 hypothetical protein THAOC_15851 [Thalassiosira oceanica]
MAQRNLFSFFGGGRGRTNAQAPAAVPPPADAAPDDAAAPPPPPPDVDDGSNGAARASAAAPDAVPSAAAGVAEEVNDVPMEVEEEGETADPMEVEEPAVMPGQVEDGQVEDGAGADRELPAALENEAEGNEAEAEAEADDEAASPGAKHDRDDEEDQPRKKQRDESEDDSEEEKKLPPVPSSPEEYADVARRWYNQHGGAFTSESTRRPPANSSQHEATYKYLYVLCVAIVTMLVAENLILLPSGILFGFINFSSDLLSMNTSSSYIYYLFWPDNKGPRRRNKVGCTSNGIERLKHYWKKFKNKTKKPTIISLLNINSIPVRVQRVVTAAILCGLAAFLPSQLPETIAEATELEMTGLPVHTTIFFWFMAKSATDCGNLGGGIIMAGCLLRLYRLAQLYQALASCCLQWPVESIESPPWVGDHAVVSSEAILLTYYVDFFCRLINKSGGLDWLLHPPAEGT